MLKNSKNLGNLRKNTRNFRDAENEFILNFKLQLEFKKKIVVLDYSLQN